MTCTHVGSIHSVHGVTLWCAAAIWVAMLAQPCRLRTIGLVFTVCISIGGLTGALQRQSLHREAVIDVERQQCDSCAQRA